MDEAAANFEKGASKEARKSWSLAVAVALFLQLEACAACSPSRHSASSAHEKTKARQDVRGVLHLDPFVANLTDVDGDHFLRVGIDLGIDQDLGEDNRGGHNKLPIARARDTILLVLTTCNAETLLPAEGKAKLKEKLVKALRERVPELGVQEVYFTEFLVQR